MDVVTVACKLGNGLILRTFREERKTVPVIGGGTRDVREFIPTGQMFTINGNAAPYAKPLLDAEGNAIMVEQSFALTPNIPKDFWELWLEQNKDAPYVKHGLIFASTKPIELRAMAKANAYNKHGLEPIDVHPNSGDPRMGPNKRQRHKAGTISEMATADVASTG
jgi:hypothetical protein